MNSSSEQGAVEPRETEAGGAIPFRCACTERRDPAGLVPHPRNPNTHPPDQIRLLARIIGHQGWRNPIVVSARSGFVVSGHGRLQAALQLGAPEVPVDVQDFATEADEWAHLVADNRLAELAEMERGELDALLREIDAAGLDVELAGFEDFGAGEDGDDEAETPPEVPFSEVIGECSHYVVLVFDQEIDWLQAQTHFDLGTVRNRRQNGKPWSKGVGRVVDGAAYLRRMTKEVADV